MVIFFSLLFLLGFVNYLYFRPCIYVKDLLEKKKIYIKASLFLCVKLLEILLSFYQSNSTYCLDNSAHSIFCNSGFGVTSLSVKSAASFFRGRGVQLYQQMGPSRSCRCGRQEVYVGA